MFIPVVVREALGHTFTFSPPDPVALVIIRHYSPGGVVEVGAGSGYWASALAAAGINVVAYDTSPGHGGVLWHAVRHGRASVAGEHGTRSLLLCWPSNHSIMASEALSAYAGDVVIVAAVPWPVVGDRRFFRQLRSWQLDVVHFLSRCDMPPLDISRTSNPHIVDEQLRIYTRCRESA